MAKRRTGVNDIIYELDNDDIELSSDDEGKESKKARFETASRSELMENKNDVSIDSNEVVMIDCSDETVSDTEASKQTQNGGKISKITYAKQDVNVDSDSNVTNNVVNVKRSCKKSGSNTIIFNEDIVVDSPASNIDLGVVGCENRTPLLTVRFKDNKLAKMYKKSIKEFMLNLIKLHTNESLNDEEDTDIELDIWPEDLIEENFDKKDEREEEVDDNLFFFDTAPCNVGQIEIPKYSQNSFLISNIPEKEETAPTTFRRGPICFNCDGDHPLRDCHLPRDNAKIAEKRKNITRVGRYHVEDDQKYGHLVPGRISGQLRHALGLKRHEIPMYIYRMRLLGYPPGWLEEARISHSGITLFDSTGNATLEPDEEEGEVCEPGSKDKFDIKKILDFPGFNVPASSRYDEEAHLYGLPPMSEQDSKMAMLQTLAPNAMKAYKRKKLTFFPSAASNSFQEGQVEMELDSGDEIVAFPSIPPLPDEEPPPAPPPPPPPPEDIKDDLTENKKNTPDIQSKKNTVSTKETSKVQEDNKIPDKNDVVSNSTSANDSSNYEKVDDDLSSDDLEIIDVLQVSDIPVPEDDLITIDDDDGVDDEDVSNHKVTSFSSANDKSLLDSGRSSPTLDDLEKKKLLLLNALKGDAVSELEDSIDDIEILEDDDKVDVDAETEGSEVKTDAVEDKIAEVDQNSIEVIDEKTAVVVDNKATPVVKEKASAVVDEKATLVISETATEEVEENAPAVNEKKPELEKSNISTPKSDVVHTTSVMETDVKTPDTKAGQVKKTLYGTPVINVASPYVKLPTEDKFAKDICDVINFENLPNSTGKFKEISTLLKKVKSEVDRIQES